MTSASPRWRRAAAGVLLGLLAVDLDAQQTRMVRPARPEPPPDTRPKTAALTGVVVSATTGAPVAGAVVALEERVPGTPVRSYVQVTTPTGRFAFVDLPASEMYLLTATRPGLLDAAFGASGSNGVSAPIALADGEWRRDVRLAMLPPGSISGRIVDERGEPVVGAHVRLLPQARIAGRTQWLAGPAARTDDRGEYRIAGLAPGSYVVSVPSVQATLPASADVKPPGALAYATQADGSLLRAQRTGERLVVDLGDGELVVVGRYAIPPPPTSDGRRTAYPVTFHPGVATPAEAGPIELGPGEHRTAIDLQLRPVPVARISGVLQGPPEAVANRYLRLLPVGLEDLGQGSEAATTLTLPDGRFTFIDVPAGAYVLSATRNIVELTQRAVESVQTVVPPPVMIAANRASSLTVRAAPPGVSLSALSDAPTDADVWWAETRIDVPERGLTDLVVLLRRAATLTGRFVLPSGVDPVRFNVVLALEPADGRRSLGVHLASRTSREDPTAFAVTGLMAGRYLMRVQFGSGVIESIVREGRDHTEQAFDATDGRDITGVVVTLTTASSVVSGVVTDGGAPIEAGAAVVAFPLERELWVDFGLNPSRIRSALTTRDGRYRLDGLPAGEYFLVAVPAALERAWLEPGFFERHAGRATRLRLDRADATIANVALSLVR